MKRVFFVYWGVNRQYVSEPKRVICAAIDEAARHDFKNCKIVSMDMGADYPENTTRTERVYNENGQLEYKNETMPWDEPQIGAGELDKVYGEPFKAE